MTHPAMAGRGGEFRVLSWKAQQGLPPSIIQAATATDSMYDLVAGPGNPPNVVATPVPDEKPPGHWSPRRRDWDAKALRLRHPSPSTRWRCFRTPRATRISLGAERGSAMALYYNRRGLRPIWWASLDAAIDQGHRSGDSGMHRETRAAPGHSGGRLRDIQRRIARTRTSVTGDPTECAQIVGPRQYRRCGPNRGFVACSSSDTGPGSR